MFDQAFYFGQELSTEGSIHHAMVAGKADVHSQAGYHLPILNHWFFDCCAN